MSQCQPQARRRRKQDDCGDHLSAPQQVERNDTYACQDQFSDQWRVHGGLHGYGLPGEIVAVIGPAEDRSSRVGGAAR